MTDWKKIIIFMLAAITAVFSDANKEAHLWYKANELADRLSGERWKFVTVKEEIFRLKNVIRDLREIQLYPENITKLTKGDVKGIRKKLKKIEKNTNKSFEILIDLEKPQEDAILISIEMLKESPNLDMVDILIKDNLFRIKDLIVVKKYVDKQWDLIHGIMDTYEQILGIWRKKDEKGLIEATFFKVLISQLGQASDVFYKKFHDYKDSLAHNRG